MKYLNKLHTNPLAWSALALSALLLEIVALYFQYEMGLEPCIMCIYQRTAIWGIFIAGVLGTVANKITTIRILSFTIWAISSVWGLLIALEHIDMQSPTLSFLYSCDFTPNFPTWAPLHDLIPFLFEATGSCGDIKWDFLGYTMPETMVVVFGCYAFALSVILVNLIALKIKT